MLEKCPCCNSPELDLIIETRTWNKLKINEVNGFVVEKEIDREEVEEIRCNDCEKSWSKTAYLREYHPKVILED